MKVNGSRIFTDVEITKLKGNTFDLTHDVVMTGNFGDLMPTLVMPCIPGDNVKLGCDMLTRMMPLIAPVMHRVNVYQHYWFVPNRLLWEGWEQYVANPYQISNAPPYVIMNDAFTPETLRFFDYMGVPPIAPGGVAVNLNALPFAAYQMIYSEFYRDQNLIPEVPFALVDGNNQANTELYTMRRRAWEHDYFTAALPQPQKGATVDIPLGDVLLKDPADWPAFPPAPNFTDGNIFPIGPMSQSAAGGIEVGPTTLNAYDPAGTLEVGATAINDLRKAFRLQEWLEKLMRGGSRYAEVITHMFGVTPQDFRLDRPEYITGSKDAVIISEVLNTTGEDGGLPQGNMAGKGASVGRGYVGKYSVKEHGYIIGIFSILPKPRYSQGIPKDYLKLDPLDLFWPQFAHIGEQPVQNQEIFAYTPQNTSNALGTFGYVPRYSEYKYMPPRIAGAIRNTLAFWTFNRVFASTPQLAQEFVECNPDQLTAPFAVTSEDKFVIQILHRIEAYRLMPVFGQPYI